MVKRTERVNKLLRSELSEIIRRHLRDPRLSHLISITRVDVSPDLRHAKAFVSVLGDEQTKKSAIEALSSASGFIKRELYGRLSMKYIPEIKFFLDQSIEEADRLSRLMDSLHPKEDEEV